MDARWRVPRPSGVYIHPGRGVCDKQQSELDLACKERRPELRREHSLTGKRWPQPPAWLAIGREDGTRES